MSIYRSLDSLDAQVDTVKTIIYEHTKKTTKNLSVVFYDLTTLYFETESENDK